MKPRELERSLTEDMFRHRLENLFNKTVPGLID